MGQIVSNLAALFISSRHTHIAVKLREVISYCCIM